MCGSVWFWGRFGWSGRWPVAEVVVASSTATCLGLDEVGSIGFDVEDHVAGVVVHCCIRVGGQVVLEHVGLGDSVGCRRGLGGGNFV